MRIGLISFSDVDSDPRVRRQVETFTQLGWDVEALAMGGPTGVPGLTVTRTRIKRRRAGKIAYLLEYAGFFLQTLGWVTWRSFRRRLDLVYVNSPPDVLALAAFPARLASIPILLDVHDPMPELWASKGGERGLFRWALETQERLGVRFADSVVTVHEPMRQLLVARNPGVEVDVVMNVPETRDMEMVSPPSESRMLVFAGTVAKRYGLGDVLEAMAIVGDDIPGLRLRVIGEGEDADDLKTMATDLDIDAEFIGRVSWEEVFALQSEAWAGVNVPKPDDLGELSFSNKVVEWIAMGLPVIASRTSTMRSYFPESALAYVTGGDPASIAAALRRLNSLSGEEREKMIESALRALDEISWAEQREELVRVMRSTARTDTHSP